MSSRRNEITEELMGASPLLVELLVSTDITRQYHSM